MAGAGCKSAGANMLLMEIDVPSGKSSLKTTENFGRLFGVPPNRFMNVAVNRLSKVAFLKRAISFEVQGQAGTPSREQ